MQTSMQGFGQQAATFLCPKKQDPGTPVMVTENGTVSAAEGEFCGVVLTWREGLAAVQLCGYVSLPYSGSKPAVGYQVLTAAQGSVQTAADGTAGLRRLVTEADDTHVGFLL